MTISKVQRLSPKILSLIGPPGSGKGSYGKLLCSKLGNIPFVTVSDVLRESSDPDVREMTSSGKLVNDVVVNDALLEKLQNTIPLEDKASSFSTSSDENTSTISCILDGFPRTIEQVQLMKKTWPKVFQLDLVINIAVPHYVCERKMLGRRTCIKCNSSYNIHDVKYEKYNLPPTLPINNDITCRSFACNPSEHWVKRSDDNDNIIGERLKVHDINTKPIVEYFKKTGQLLKFEPYNGYSDVDQLHVQLQQRYAWG